MNDINTIKTKLELYFKLGKNVLIEGNHGTGKTSLITEIFNKNCKKWLYFSGSTLDPWVDFVGVPKEVQKGDNLVLSFVLPERMADDSVEAIFIDEYNRSHVKVRNATMELTQFKSINGRKFPNLKVVWVAINPYEDEENNYDVEQIDDAQLDRFQIKIKMPNEPDFEYFTQKYGKKFAESAIEWWNGLPKKILPKISPRRLDYALELYLEDGDILDVLPLESNPIKLLTTLKVGSLEKKLKSLFSKQEAKPVKEFFEEENNYQSALPIIKKNNDYMKFFLPILDDERVSSLYFSDKVFKDFILANAAYFKQSLEEIAKFKGADKAEISNINRALKQVGNITYFS